MKASIALNQENLSQLPPNIRVPNYDRNKVKTSIVHIGVGNFHRSHEAYYTNELMEKHGILDCGICGVGLLDFDRKIYNILKDQDGLYTLVTKNLDGSLSAQVIGSIVEYLFAPENPLAVIEKMAHEDIKIISLTITEGGYNLNEATGEFDFSNSVIVEDMKNPDSPKTVFGYLAQALKLRMLRGVGGCTIQSCDNMQGNGDVAKKSLLNYIEKAEPELKTWVEQNVSFPNAMVDRITPVTIATDIEKLQSEFMIVDQWPVVCEPFVQWVIEDEFSAGRPAWEKVGAQFVDDVIPFENMKLRLLNAGHTVLGMLGALHGYKTIDEAAKDEEFHIFLRAFMDFEVTPTLGELGGIDLEAYKDSLIERFQNIYIKDLISRICLQSSAKVPIFLLSTIREQLNSQANIERAAFVVAAWCKYNDGIDELGKSYEIDDAMSNDLVRAAALSHQDPLKFIQLEAIFGDLSENKTFAKAFVNALLQLRSSKVKDCVREINQHNDKKIVCFGEVLWDNLPTGRKLGGAPLNVALRAQSFGNRTTIISSIGDDKYGQEIISLMKELNADCTHIQKSNNFNTSEVLVHLDEQGSASYEIKKPCAWDDIQQKDEDIELIKSSDAFIYGSLSTRCETSYNTLKELLKQGKYNVFDVNLRPPHYSIELLNELMTAAHMIKMNDEELIEICESLGFENKELKACIEFISKKTNTPAVCVTRGSKGAILFIDGKYHTNAGYKITVADTVGAGDSFLASLVSKLLNGSTPQNAIDFSSAVGALVASKEGANPELTIQNIVSFMNKIE